MQPDQGSAPDGQHGQPDVSLAWEEGQTEALPRQRPMYCSSQKRGIYFPVTFLKERGWNPSARSLQGLSRTILASSKDLWPNRQNGGLLFGEGSLIDFQVSRHMPKNHCDHHVSSGICLALSNLQQETGAGEWLAGQYRWTQQPGRDSYFNCLIYVSKVDAQLSLIFLILRYATHLYLSQNRGVKLKQHNQKSFP